MGGTAGGKRTFRRKVLVFVCVFVLTFAVCYIWHRAFWPGSFSADSNNQYTQALRGEYNDWHPFLHTLIFFRLPMTVSGEVAFIIMFQYTLFALAVAFLFWTMYDLEIPGTAMGLSLAFLLLNPNTAKIMIVPWKDGAMTIFALLMFTLLLRMFRAPKEWNRHRAYAVLLGIAAFLTNQMRHNAILLVGGVFLFVILLYRMTRRKMLLSLAVFLVLTVMAKGPLYHWLNVGDPSGRNAEISGLPMTVLCDIYVSYPETLDEEVAEFMEACATETGWAQHEKGNFDSLKLTSDTAQSMIEEKGAATVLEYAVRSAVRNPVTAMQAVLSLTRLVWQFEGGTGWTISTNINGSNSYGIAYHDDNRAWAEILEDYAQLVSDTSLKLLFNYTGMMILLMLITGVARIGKAGVGRSFLVLAPMAYNFGTMLLLSGGTFRLFHFNFVIIVPVSLILLFTSDASDGETKAPAVEK